MAENEKLAAEHSRFLSQIKWFVVGLLLLFAVLLYIYAFYLDAKLSAIDRHTSPEFLVAEDAAHGDIFHLSANPAQGQIVYVPAYSHVFHREGEPHRLTITLSVRNTSLDHTIVVKSIRYFDTRGKEIKSHLTKPVRLPALAATEIVVGPSEKSGGSGANFLVEWYSDKPVTEPIIEAVMIDFEREEGISFVRRGSVISEIAPRTDDRADGEPKTETDSE